MSRIRFKAELWNVLIVVGTCKVLQNKVLRKEPSSGVECLGTCIVQTALAVAVRC